jgi:hypothetical protein
MTDTPDNLAALIVAAYRHGVETACLSDDVSDSRARQSEVGRLQNRIAEMECDHKACLAAVAHNSEENIRAAFTRTEEAQEALAAEVKLRDKRFEKFQESLDTSIALREALAAAEQLVSQHAAEAIRLREELAAERVANERLQAANANVVERVRKAEPVALHLADEAKRLQAEIERLNVDYQRVWMANEAAQRELGRWQAGRVCGVTHQLLNDLSMVANLPGSPTYADCIRSIIEELPRLRSEMEQLRAGIRFTPADVENCRLGRAVNAMPDGCGIYRGTIAQGKYTEGPWTAIVEKPEYGDDPLRCWRDSPIEALKAAGIGTNGDDDSDGEKGRQA